MKVNIYFLVVGILCILFSLTHAWNGQTTLLHIIDGTNLDIFTKTTIFYVWHIITAENVIFGVALILMAFYKDVAKVKFTSWLIAAVLIGRWCVIYGSVLFKNGAAIKSTLSDSIAIAVLVTLLLLGTWKRV